MTDSFYFDGMQERRAVIAQANSMVGTYWRRGETCQCANFVRYVFDRCHCPLGVAAVPSDNALLPFGSPIGASYADSFAGDDVGEKIKRDALQGGDIVMFRNTYGDFPEGVITHVGIMVSSDSFVHRPTADRPVEHAFLNGSWARLFAEGRRPLAFLPLACRAKLFAHNQKAKAYIKGSEVKEASFKAFLNDKRARLFAHSGKETIEAAWGTLMLALDDKRKMRLTIYPDKTYKMFDFRGLNRDPKAVITLQAYVKDGTFRLCYDLGNGHGMTEIKFSDWPDAAAEAELYA